MPRGKNKAQNENMRKKERKLPKSREYLGFWEKRSLKNKGKQDGQKDNSFNRVTINGREIQCSQFMLREIETFQEFRDNCFNYRFIVYTDIDTGKVIRGATFTSWINYLDNRIAYAGWRIIPEEKTQEYRRWRNEANAVSAELAAIPDPATKHQHVQYLRSELAKFTDNMQIVVNAALAERNAKLTTLCEYLEEKRSMIAFMEAHLTPKLTHINTRIGHYFSVAAAYNDDLDVQNKPRKDELFLLLDGENGCLMGDYEQDLNRTEAKLEETQTEIKQLKAADIKRELDDATS